MISYKQFDNGLRLIVNKMDGLLSVSCGIMVKTGSANESEEENGISHFIEHNLFKGTKTRTAFDISDYIDKIGAQINAYTSKETTCYYTKSTAEHYEECLEVLSDIFFNSVFDEVELEKEKGVVIEEIKMSEDTPEDICFDLLAESRYGKKGLGRTILGPEKTVRKFTRQSILDYMDKYYTADNVILSIAGNVDIDNVISAVGRLFADKFTKFKSKAQVKSKFIKPQSLYKCKKIEQSHIALSMPAFSMHDSRRDALVLANYVLGGGMSSRLFQKIREEMGLCYSVYSYVSQYKDSGVCEVYAGVNTQMRDDALKAIVEEIQKFKKGITKNEFERGKEQIKSSFIFGEENTGSQMLLLGRYLLYFGEIFDFSERIDNINKVSYEDVSAVINEFFDLNDCALATVGTKRSKLSI